MQQVCHTLCDPRWLAMVREAYYSGLNGDLVRTYNRKLLFRIYTPKLLQPPKTQKSYRAEYFMALFINTREWLADSYHLKFNFDAICTRISMLVPGMVVFQVIERPSPCVKRRSVDHVLTQEISQTNHSVGRSIVGRQVICSELMNLWCIGFQPHVP